MEEMLESIEDQLVEWELRWRDQAEKEDEIHQGVVALTDKLTELTGKLGEVRVPLSDDEYGFFFAEEHFWDKEQAENVRLRNDLAMANRQISVLRQLKLDVETENTVLYDSFNEELDTLFDDATLPADEAFAALRKQVTSSKLETKSLQRQLAEKDREIEAMTQRNEQALSVLRRHGLIS
jgi:DNA repair exonuclease SbcCD ATPase subunit